jgi:hypothetical protein
MLRKRLPGLCSSCSFVELGVRSLRMSDSTGVLSRCQMVGGSFFTTIHHHRPGNQAASTFQLFKTRSLTWQRSRRRARSLWARGTNTPSPVTPADRHADTLAGARERVGTQKGARASGMLFLSTFFIRGSLGWTNRGEGCQSTCLVPVNFS